MAVRVALQHHTTYRYDRLVRLSPHVIRLRPAPHCRTDIEAFALKVEPRGHFINWQQDPFGNYLARVVFPDPVSYLKVSVDLVADLVTVNPFDFFLEPHAERYPFEYTPAERQDLQAYLQPTATAERFAELVDTVRREYAAADRRVVDVLVDINQHLQRTIRYDIRMEPGVFAPDETLERGHGSCRDFAWLLVNVLRNLGLAARFVSGYSIQLVADQKPVDGPAGVSSDCTDLHAWAEVFLPGAGWIGLDATSGLLCGEGHIPLACTAEPTGAAPITGSFDFSPEFEGDEPKTEFAFTMNVTRIEDRPRPTRSYTEQQWNAILECGARLDRLLNEQDVRLTMGGEPTFVSIDDMEGAEWNTEAQGPTKALLSDQLLRRLRKRFAPSALMFHGQGKWYPGEPLPRYAYSLYFRKDGEPVWHDEQWVADGTNLGFGPEQAQEFLTRIAESLGVSTDKIMPGHEDVYYYLWRERRLPGNVDPFDSRLDDELERARLQRVFEQGLKHVAGYALPLRALASSESEHTWETGDWFLRAERLYLIPGDSPMGYRLPLDSLPWAIESERGTYDPQDPYANYPPLTPRSRLVAERRVQMQPWEHTPTTDHPVELSHRRGKIKPWAAADTSPSFERFTSASDVVRTALCVEPRGGVLHVFLPPLPTFAAFLELTARIEKVAEELKRPVRIEGYPPPYHPQLQRISVTPDPGVIEVNIHPASSWQEIVDNTVGLYEDARQTRLGTNKFMLDGRHTGTGGGNHLVLGGATPGDSPFLRRPWLLTSLVAFFNNHPALSYVFSGLFVGPTSQAPRIDEGRNDSLYELEIARRTLAEAGTNAPPWLIDRALRNLLVDVTGNTHRAEFCIDKLYSPDTSTGRLGLVEMRAFEMPPDARMSCAQQLLVRSLVARFWQTPYERPLVRWNTTLHDRFALPHYLWQDLVDAIEESSLGGLALEPQWFLPHWEFRFPRYGKIASRGIEVELRQAVEPWHVLGEEAVEGGTARYVDSSVERVQVLVSGMTDTRHIMSLNGYELPLSPTGRSGEFVTGVRFKAWKPPYSLHPTLDRSEALIFDLYDTWNQRAVGGCTYHVAHPGGRTFDTHPANGLEAESRRRARFFPFGHSPGRFEIHSPTRSLEHPLTFDLRRQS